MRFSLKLKRTLSNNFKSAWAFDVEARETGAGDGADSPGVQSDLVEASEPDFEVGVRLSRSTGRKAVHATLMDKKTSWWTAEVVAAAASIKRFPRLPANATLAERDTWSRALQAAYSGRPPGR
ncbi:hypothetical protein GCM10027447_06790 [Glycomyces halotolerans]